LGLLADFRLRTGTAIHVPEFSVTPERRWVPVQGWNDGFETTSLSQEIIFIHDHQSITSYFFHQQKIDAMGMLGMALIIAGVVVLNLFSKSGVH
jgi:hypothetical protein